MEGPSGTSESLQNSIYEQDAPAMTLKSPKNIPFGMDSIEEFDDTALLPTNPLWDDEDGDADDGGLDDLPAAGNDRPRRRGWRLALAAVAGLVLVTILFAILLARRVAPPSSPHTITSGASATLPATVQDLQQAIVNDVKTVTPSLVEVDSQGGGNATAALGTGDIIRSDGYILTNDHVVRGYTSFTVKLSDGKTYAAQLTGEAPQDDLAVLKIAATGLKPITFADSNAVKVGEFAVAIGNPLGLDDSVTLGIVSALNRTESEAPDGPANELTGLIQTSAPINPGNSGGALVDLQGHLIGIPTLGASDTQDGASVSGIGFAIPSDHAQTVANQLIAHGSFRAAATGQSFLGIQGVDVTPSLAQQNQLPVQHGVLVVGFAADTAGASPAQQAGVMPGDIITAIDGKAVNGNGNLVSALNGLHPGATATLTLQRGQSQTTARVTLGDRPANDNG
jgi:S1-C subfamily serine protease